MTGRAIGSEVERAVADAHRREWAFVLAATTRTTRDLDLAEEAVQDAYVSALTAWARDGIPSSPGAWLTTAARRNALNALRRGQVLRTKLPLLLEREPAEEDDPMDTGAPDAIPDDRLRLVFTCCHPALAREAQVALTLRLVCGVATGDIAQAFLVSEPTMAARLTRAKKKIAAARIPYVVPAAEDLPERLDAVLGVIHLLYTVGHTAPSGEDLVRADLAERAIDLARMLRALLPEPEVLGLLALLVVNHARRATRTDAGGRLQRLADQDRTAWDRDADRRGRPARRRRARRRTARSLHAAGGDRHAARRGRDVRPDRLGADPRPVRRAARGLAVAGRRAEPGRRARDGGGARRPRSPRSSVSRTTAALARYHYLPATKADLLVRLDRRADAAAAYRAALDLADNDAERAFLADRLAECAGAAH